MSAIWGMVDFEGRKGNSNLATMMERPYHSYKIDT